MSEFQNYYLFLFLNIVSTLANSVDSDAVFHCYRFSVQNGLTLNALKDYSFWFDTINLGWSIAYKVGSKVINPKNKNVFLSMKMAFVLANSVDPDEMLQYAAFHLGLHCFSKYTFWSH